MTRRRGVTLVELLVVLTVLAAVATVSGLALGRLRPADDLGASARIDAMRRDAIHHGVSVTRTIRHEGRTITVSVLADGRVIGDAASRLVVATGAPLDVAP